jgi:hypothetical protein
MALMRDHALVRANIYDSENGRDDSLAAEFVLHQSHQTVSHEARISVEEWRETAQLLSERGAFDDQAFDSRFAKLLF